MPNGEKMDLFAQMVNELKDTKYTTILYGAGIWAHRLKRYFENNSVDFKGYAVDDERLPKDRQCEGKPVYSLNEYIAENDCNVVIAFLNCSKEKENELRKNSHIKKLYAVDLSRFCMAGNVMRDEFYQANQHILDRLRNDLCDDESKFQFDEFITQKRVGNYRKRFSHNPQYFDKDIINFTENEVLVDCGAYDGDTVLQFIDIIQSNDMFIYAFEADSGNVDKMKMRLRDLNNVQIIPKGVYDQPGTLFFDSSGTTSSRISDSGEKIEVTTIDDVVKDNNVTFIKMDIEGSELKALKGAKETIKRCSPKLAICVYHRSEDLITIPQYIQSLNPDYKLYFRNYAEQGVESVIYAIQRR